MRWVGVALVLAMAAVSSRASDVHPNSAELLDLLKESNRPLTDGTDCKDLAEYHRTLGALVRYFGRQANRRKTARCGRSNKGSGVLSCSAEFANKVPSERSEEEFSLEIHFELRNGAVATFSCIFAD